MHCARDLGPCRSGNDCGGDGFAACGSPPTSRPSTAAASPTSPASATWLGVHPGDCAPGCSRRRCSAASPRRRAGDAFPSTCTCSRPRWWPTCGSTARARRARAALHHRRLRRRRATAASSWAPGSSASSTGAPAPCKTTSPTSSCRTPRRPRWATSTATAPRDRGLQGRRRARGVPLPPETGRRGGDAGGRRRGRRVARGEAGPVDVALVARREPFNPTGGGWAGPTLADLDDDGRPEVLRHGMVFRRADGRVPRRRRVGDAGLAGYSNGAFGRAGRRRGRRRRARHRRGVFAVGATTRAWVARGWFTARAARARGAARATSRWPTSATSRPPG
jgi:hypothetical protein